MKRMIAAVALLGVALLGNAGASADAGTQAYHEGKFEEAKAAYQAEVAKTPTAVGYYNLGNAAYRLGEKAEAILAWERALALDPSLAEAAANLRQVRDQVGAVVELPGPVWQQALVWPYETFRAYALWIAALGFWLLLFGVAPVLWGRRVSMVALVLGVVTLSFFGGSVLWAWSQPPLGIVTVEKADARQAPVDASKLEMVLPQGSRVRLLRESGEWLQVQLPRGGKGWLPKKSVTPVIPE